ncbi:hypothetical protein HK414_22335 [Ramlibacter terrae]|uniref:Uncharacterized protein n=1 Tax=Ramlibacter terrae TaxID=2732511 RepID=A0ABX6P530_9BURK|nr:hypothetical protein HK414_22335 [Ramlibacter terrae]
MVDASGEQQPHVAAAQLRSRLADRFGAGAFQLPGTRAGRRLGPRQRARHGARGERTFGQAADDQPVQRPGSPAVRPGTRSCRAWTSPASSADGWTSSRAPGGVSGVRTPSTIHTSSPAG